MLEYCCDACGKLFYRFPSQVRGVSKTCSKECRYALQKETLKGKGNPNYKKGIHCSPSFCKCGKEKDYRANACAICSGASLPKRPEYRKTDEEIIEAAAHHTSYFNIAQAIGVPRRRVKEVLDAHNIDTSHFCVCKDRPIGFEKVFTYHAKRNNMLVRRYLLLYEVFPYHCAMCGLEDEWNGSRLTLQLDHIDGDPCNNFIENLRWLCPNCHTQTSTYCGRKARGKSKK